MTGIPNNIPELVVSGFFWLILEIMALRDVGEMINSCLGDAADRGHRHDR